MRLIWFSWKDKKHPETGGAETVTDHILTRLAKDGHEVILLSSQPAGLPAEEVYNGYKIIRGGSRYSVYLKARSYYKRNLKGWADVVIEEINTIPFFTHTYVKEPSLLFFHQLAREVWFYQMPWPVSRIGYILEPLYLRSLRKQHVITVSNSTKNDLIETADFSPEKIQIIREGIELTPLKKLSDVKKYNTPTLLSLGSVRPMKRTADIVSAFEFAKEQMPELKLIIAGNNNGPYGEQVKKQVEGSIFKKDISMLGGVSLEKKQEVMERSHVMAVTSVKEGWGLVVTEANSQGTPVVAYNVDGLRDSVKNNKTGIVTDANPKALAKGIVEILKDAETYDRMRKASWEDSKQYTFETLYQDFLNALEKYRR